MRIQPRMRIGLWGLVLAVLVMAAAPSWASETTAKLMKTQGLVEVSSASPTRWASAHAGRVLHPGDAVRTGSRASAIIELDGAEVTLYETTLLRIPMSASTVSTAGDSPWRHPLLDQGRGLFNVIPGRTPAGFSVRTPMLVAGVKGTIFEVIATGTEHAVYVWEGAVEVGSLLDPTDLQLVAAGEHTMLDDLRLTPSQPMPVERERPEGAYRGTVKPDVTPGEDHVQQEPIKHEEAIQKEERIKASLKVTEVKEEPIDHAAVLESWREADRIAVDLASDGMADFQTIVSSGELRQPVAVNRLGQTLTSTTKTLSATTSTAPPTAATDTTASSSTNTAPISSVVDPLASTVTTTVSAITDPLVSTTTTTLSTVTDPLLSTVTTTVPTVTSTVSSVTTAATTPVLSTVTTVVDPVTGSTSRLVDTVSGLLGP